MLLIFWFCHLCSMTSSLFAIVVMVIICGSDASDCYLYDAKNQEWCADPFVTPTTFTLCTPALESPSWTGLCFKSNVTYGKAVLN